jgi:hypothetical protein
VSLLTACGMNWKHFWPYAIEKILDLVCVFRVLRLEERKFDCEYKEDFVECSSNEEGWKIPMLIFKNSGIKNCIHACQFLMLEGLSNAYVFSHIVHWPQKKKNPGNKKNSQNTNCYHACP